MRNIRIWSVKSKDHHRLPGAALISRFLLVEESVINHVVRPIEICIVMKEREYEIFSVDRSGVMGQELAYPRQHQGDVYTSKIAEFGRIYSSTSRPSSNEMIGYSEGGNRWEGALNVSKISDRF